MALSWYVSVGGELSLLQRQVERRQAVVVLGAAVIVFSLVGAARFLRDAPQPPASSPSVRVPLFLDPARVDHVSRLRFTFDPAEALLALREEERLDSIVVGARSDDEAFRRLMTWAGDQWQRGTPNPYPPPDARVILRDIRAGLTGGFCAQYCFVLIQAIQSFGVPARMVTIDGHEVVEAWLRDESRWVVLDPTYSLQVLNDRGRTLSALDIRRSREEGATLELTQGHHLAESKDTYLDRYRLFAVWIRNDFVSRPMNFTDFSRYRVWFDPAQDAVVPAESLTTPFEEDLYPGIGGGGL
jgi:hypothetical protein